MPIFVQQNADFELLNVEDYVFSLYVDLWFVEASIWSLYCHFPHRTFAWIVLPASCDNADLNTYRNLWFYMFLEVIYVLNLFTSQPDFY